MPHKPSIWAQTQLPGYIAVSLKLSYRDWVTDSTAFFNNLEEQLSLAATNRLTVMPVLLTDDDFNAPHLSLAEYVGTVIGKYYCDTRIKAWELYHHPGEKVTAASALRELITLIFRHARNQYANQPLTMTPYVQVKPFAPDFNYWGALVHGHRAGWDYLTYGGGSSAELCYQIWSLSDIIAFSSAQKAPETGWLASICYRFGRPIFCTEWNAPAVEDIVPTLERFAISQLHWFSGQEISSELLDNFAFKQISTQRQVTEGIF